MQSKFDQDLLDLGEKVTEALGLLEQQTYIQRNGEMYEFLTDEEKDIEQDIKNTDVDFWRSVVRSTRRHLFYRCGTRPENPLRSYRAGLRIYEETG